MEFPPGDAYSRKQLPVQRAVLDGLKDVIRTDVGCSRQIRQSPGDFQDPVMGAGGEVHLFHGVFQIAVGFGDELAMLSDLAGTRGRIRRIGRFTESLKRNLTRGYHPLPDGFRGLTGVYVGRKFEEVHQRNFLVQIDAIQ